MARIQLLVLLTVAGAVWSFQQQHLQVISASRPSVHRQPKSVRKSETTYGHSIRTIPLRVSIGGDQLELPADSLSSGPSLYSLDPDSEQAKSIIVDMLGLSEPQFEQIQRLSTLVTEWNKRINLVSRKDCNPSTVLGRHILPALAACSLQEGDNPLVDAKTVVDIGTGGGFPGLPLAIANPEKEFLLVDSVGKKLVAVKDMTEQLGLSNVEIHHGRAESLTAGGRRFDVATGRSVSALPQFCTWMHHLLHKDTGKLMYWIGGDIEEKITRKCTLEIALTDLVPEMESDKRILIFPSSAVTAIAKQSGIAIQKIGDRSRKTKNGYSRTGNPKAKAKGAWRKRDDNTPKQRGYENFKRYDSNNV